MTLPVVMFLPRAMRLIAGVVAASLIAGSYASAALTALISTERVALAERARRGWEVQDGLLEAIDRPEVAAALVARGVSPAEARERIMALTEAESGDLERRMDTAPSGGFWLTPFFVTSLVVALMYVVNRLDIIDRLVQTWVQRSPPVP